VSNIVVEVRRRARGNVTAPMVLWAIVMAVVIFLMEVRWSGSSTPLVAGVVVTAAFGLYLGLARRTAAVLVAPVVSWFFAWPLLWIAAMIHHGFLKGFFAGLFLVTIGWIGIGFAEFVWLGLVALLGRTLRGTRGGPDVMVFGPGGTRVD
jgi:hypothetical protein